MNSFADDFTPAPTTGCSVPLKTAESTRRLKIAMIGQKGLPPTYGGVEHHVASLSAGLVGRGHQVTVFCRPYYCPDLDQHPDVSVCEAGEYVYNGIRLALVRSLKTKHFDAITHSALSALCSARNRYDIVHFHGIGPSLVSFLPAWCGTKVVSTVHALDFRQKKWGSFARISLKAGLRCAVTFPEKTICVSRTIREYLRNDDCTVYIPNGVRDVCGWGPDELEWMNSHGLQPEEYVLFVGRLIEDKGCHHLIQAVRELGLPLKVAVAGDSSFTDDYVHRLKAAASPETVFLGSVYDEKLSALYANCSLFVLPSSIEGLPLVLIEAMRHGAPVLVSDIPENLEIVNGSPDSGPLALTFMTGNIRSLKDALVFARSNSPFLTSMVARAKIHVEEQYRWDTIVSATERVYYEALGCSPSDQ